MTVRVTRVKGARVTGAGDPSQRRATSPPSLRAGPTGSPEPGSRGGPGPGSAARAARGDGRPAAVQWAANPKRTRQQTTAGVAASKAFTPAPSPAPHTVARPTTRPRPRRRAGAVHHPRARSVPAAGLHRQPGQEPGSGGQQQHARAHLPHLRAAEQPGAAPAGGPWGRGGPRGGPGRACAGVAAAAAVPRGHRPAWLRLHRARQTKPRRG